MQKQNRERRDDDSFFPVWMATTFNANGQLEGELFGNGVNTKRVFDPFTGELLRIKSGVGEELIRDITYSYDSRSNVKQRLYRLHDESERFNHDAFDRLTKWTYRKGSQNTTRMYRYDTRGNMLFKSNAGRMVYDAGDHLISREKSGTTVGYSYDANGNMLSGGNITYRWTPFNKVKQIRAHGKTMEWSYDADQSRAVKTVGNETTYYFSKDYELVVTRGRSQTIRKMRHHIFVGNEVVATHEKNLINGERQGDKTAFMHRDALGSVDTVTDNRGRVVLSKRYTPFGEKLSIKSTSPAVFRHSELRGYTGHEHILDNLINMNGRVYHAHIARFISADSIVPDPSMVMAYNRYIYVLNNPMRYKDPTGQFAVEAFIVAIVAYTFAMTTDDPTLQRIASVVSMVAFGKVWPAPANAAQAFKHGATLGFIKGLLEDGPEGALKGGVLAGIQAALAFEIGDIADHDFTLKSVTGHMLVSGVIAEVRGGKFRHGALSALAGKVGGATGNLLFGEMPENLNNMTSGEFAGRAAIAVTFGGLASEASGGDFSDGAVTSLMIYLFNDKLSGRGREKRNLKITDEQRQLAVDGKVKEFWESRLTMDDPVAQAALASLNPSNDPIDYFFGGAGINNRLIAYDRVYGSGNLNIDQVRLDLINAHIDMTDSDTIGIVGLLHPRQIAQYHHEVFANYNLPSTAFGGTPWTGQLWEADVTRAIWCGGCDRQ